MIKKLLLPLSFMFIFFGCKKDKGVSNQLLGKWYYARLVIYSGKDGKELKREEGNTCEKKSYKEFLSGGVLKDAGYAQINKKCESTGFGPNRYKYDVSAKKIIAWFDSNGENSPTGIYLVRSITATQLELQLYERDVNGDGVDDPHVYVCTK